MLIAQTLPLIPALTLMAVITAIAAAALASAWRARRQLREVQRVLAERGEELDEVQDLLADADDRLEELDHRDVLTDLFDRRYLEATLETEWKRCSRAPQPISLIMVAIDLFADYSSGYGRLEVESCLRQVSEALAPLVHRPHDVVARYGGEQFCILLPEVDEDGARIVADRIPLAIRALEIPNEYSRVEDFVTVSVGVATRRPSPIDAPTGLVTVAASALRAAQDNGHNRVCVGSPGRS